MNRYNIQLLDLEKEGTWDQVFGGTQGRYISKGDDQPKHSPIRRKSKMRQTENILPIPRRSHERVRHRVKDKLQGEYILDYWDEDVWGDV